MVSGFKLSSRLVAFMREFLPCTRANLTMILALSAPVLMAAGGLATDYATFSMKVSNLQAVADTAALAGAKELGLASSQDSTVIASAKSYVKSSLSADDAGTTVNITIDRNKGTVHVLLQEAWQPNFGSFINAGMTPIDVAATAALAGAKNLCIMALSPDHNRALHLDKSASITANGCSVYSDSSHTNGLTVDDNAAIHADVTCSVGGIKLKGTIVPAGITDCAVVPDPLMDRQPPPVASCSFSNKVITSGAAVLLPGNYCGGLKISGTAQVVFAPGNYVISDGPFEISGTSSASGVHVGFHLIGDKALINFKDSANITFAGPRDGPLAGLLFFEDRSQPIDGKHEISSSNVKALTGTIYLPQGYLMVDPSGSVLASSAFTAIVVRRLELSSSGNLVMNSNYGGTDVPVPSSIKSSLTVVLAQ